MTLSTIAGGRASAVWGLQIAWPNSNTLRYASSPYTSAGLGHFHGKVIKWGGLNYYLSDRGGRLPAVETRVRIDDTDRTIQRIYSGAYADAVRGSVATQYLMTPAVASGSWLTVFSGVVTKVSFPEPFVAEITMRTNDDQIQRSSPSGGWALTRQQWPSADPEVFGTFAPIIYGYHDASTTQTGPGLIPTPYVDTLLYRYLVCGGKAKAVTRVYVNGVVVGSGYTVSYVTRSGRSYTVITFTADQGTAKITCDVEGYENVGDGSGAVITNPATQLAHRLSNFVLGDYMTGAWLSTHSLIDSAALSAAEAYFSALTARASVYSAEKKTGTEIIAQYCNSWLMRCYWTLAGTIATGYENVFASPYSGTRWRWYKDEVGPFILEDDDFQVTSRILSSSNHSASQDAYLAALEVVDASVSSDTQEAIERETSESK